MSSTHGAPGGAQNRPHRGATPTPRHLLAAATPYAAESLKAAMTPAEFIRIPKQISFWGNYDYGDCVTAEEAFAKACNRPEIFIPQPDVIAWAKDHSVLNGAELHQVMVWMQTDGF